MNGRVAHVVNPEKLSTLDVGDGDFTVDANGNVVIAGTLTLSGDELASSVLLAKFALAVAGAAATNGVLAYGPELGDSFKVKAQGTPSMRFEVNVGWGVYSSWPFQLSTPDTDYVSALQVAPVVNSRIDTVSIDPATGIPAVTEGVQSATPSAPATPAGHLKLAEIYHRVGSTSIQDTDDASNSYITLARNMINFGGQE